MESTEPKVEQLGAVVLPNILEFDVTEEDILLGAKACSTSCMVSRALRRTLKLRYGLETITHVFFEGFSVYTDEDHFELIGGYKHDARSSIVMWDAEYPVSPFTVRATKDDAARRYGLKVALG